MAIVLMRKTGRPASSSPYGITDPKGNPCCLREMVERVPIRPRYTSVRARSANVGSATAGWLPVTPEPACFPIDIEDISLPPLIAGPISIFVPTSTTGFSAPGVDEARCGSIGPFGDYARVTAYREATLRRSENARESVFSVISHWPLKKPVSANRTYQDWFNGSFRGCQRCKDLLRASDQMLAVN